MSDAVRAAKPKGPTTGKVGRPCKAVTDRLDETLLDLAIQAMRDAEFSEISLERLAARIGVSRPTLYRRFKNRGALLEAMVEREFAALFHVEDMPGQAASPLDALRAHARRMLAIFAQPSTANFVKFQALESTANPRLSEFQRQWHLRTVSQLRPLITAAQESGALGTTSAERLAHLLISLLNTPLSLMNMGFTPGEAMLGMSQDEFFDWRFGVFLNAADHQPAERHGLLRATRHRRP